VTNTLAYNGSKLIAVVKKFCNTGPGTIMGGVGVLTAKKFEITKS
jgi:hypothetical protein